MTAGSYGAELRLGRADAGEEIAGSVTVVLCGPYGFRAVILDSEGNRVALHSK